MIPRLDHNTDSEDGVFAAVLNAATHNILPYYAALLSNTVIEDELMRQRINSSDSAGHLRSVQITAECT